MTNLEIILANILWIITGIFLGNKWEKADKIKDNRNGADGIMLISIAFMPIVLIISLIRQFLIEDWK